MSTQAAATAAAEDVERLEAAYQHAFTTIETLVAAIERVHQLRVKGVKTPVQRGIRVLTPFTPQPPPW